MLHIMLACTRTHEFVSTGSRHFYRVTGSFVADAVSCVRSYAPLDQERYVDLSGY